MIAHDRLVCDAGRIAFFGGQWTMPCLADVEKAGRVHVIYAASGDKIELCDEHFDQVNRAGLVSEPFAGRDQVRQRIGREPD
jgi:hypothetical protein